MDQNLDPVGSGIIAKDADDILRPVGSGKDPPPPFFHNRNAAGLEKGDQILVEKPGEGVIKKFAVVMEIFDEGGQVPGVGQVAPALAGDGQFDPHPAHFLQEENPASLFGGPSGSHQAGGPPADDNHIPTQGHFTAEIAETAEKRNFSFTRTNSNPTFRFISYGCFLSFEYYFFLCGLCDLCGE
jgi:hypothetical protein